MAEWYKDADVYTAEEQANFVAPGSEQGAEKSEQKSENSQQTEQRNMQTEERNMVISQVLAPAKTGGKAAPWKPGQSGNPHGRPRKEVEQAVIQAVDRGASPERIEASLNRLYELAEQYGSWKAHEAYLKLALPYQLGAPTQRVIQEDSALANILETIRKARNPE